MGGYRRQRGKEIVSFLILLMQVDGQEDISAGLDLYEFSEVLQELGCWQAVVRKKKLVIIVYLYMCTILIRILMVEVAVLLYTMV